MIRESTIGGIYLYISYIESDVYIIFNFLTLIQKTVFQLCIVLKDSYDQEY